MSKRAPTTDAKICTRLPWATWDRLVALAEVWRLPVQRVAATLLERGLRDAEACGVCRICGCSEWDACVDDEDQPCGWAAEDLCTRCAGTEYGVQSTE